MRASSASNPIRPAAGSADDVTGGRLCLVLEGVARLGHGQRPAGRGAALLHDVGELVRKQLLPVGRAGGVLAPGGVDVAARGGRAPRDAPGAPARLLL